YRFLDMATSHLRDVAGAGFARLLTFLLVPSNGPLAPTPTRRRPIPCTGDARGSLALSCPLPLIVVNGPQGPAGTCKAIARVAVVPEVGLAGLAVPGFRQCLDFRHGPQPLISGMGLVREALRLLARELLPAADDHVAVE